MRAFSRFVSVILVIACGCSSEPKPDASSSVSTPPPSNAPPVTTRAESTTNTVRTPIDPEALGYIPDIEGTRDIKSRVTAIATRQFTEAFGGVLPSSFQLKDTTGWYSEDGKLHQIRAEASLSREQFQLSGWTDSRIPKHVAEAIHMPPDVPRSFLACFTGSIDGMPAQLLWFQSEQVMMLIADL